MTKEINEIVDAITEHPTLDRFLDRAPKSLTEAEFEELVRVLRAQRAMFMKNEAERKAKRREE